VRKDSNGSGELLPEKGYFSVPRMNFRALCGCLLKALLFPAFIILCLLLVFPFLCRYSDCFQNYYAFIAVTVIAFIPWVNSIILRSTAGKIFKYRSASFLSEVAISAALNILVMIPVIFITDAVASEGWLRTIFVSLNFGISGPLVFKAIEKVRRAGRNRLTVLAFTLLLPLTIPPGLILHHPFNYLLFPSPYYWIGWSWIISSPAESLLYGSIGALLAVLCGVYAYRSAKGTH